jgi:hypothetical protein
MQPRTNSPHRARHDARYILVTAFLQIAKDDGIAIYLGQLA